MLSSEKNILNEVILYARAKSREAQAYTSVSNVLEVRIIGGSTEQTKGTRYFILKYKGRRNQYLQTKGLL